MSEISPISRAGEGEEHEEGEISDEEALPLVSSEEVATSRVQESDEAVEPPSSDRDPPLLHRRASLDDLIEGGSELRAGHTRKLYRGRGDLDLNLEDDDNGHKRNGWGAEEKSWQRGEFSANGAYGSNLYNFAWAQAVSGRPSFSSTDSSTIEAASSKLSGDRVSSGSPGLVNWSLEKRKLSREISRDSEFYRRAGRSSEERDDSSPTTENGGRGERGSSERSGRTRDVKWTERPQTLRSRIEREERSSDDEDVEGEESRRRKERSESQSPNGRLDEVEGGGRSSSDTVQVGQNGEENGGAEDREEGELEEGEIELSSLPAERSPSPSKDVSDTNRQSKYNGSKATDYWIKDKTYARSAPKSQSRSQIEEYSSARRHRQTRSQESQREKRLSLAGDLVKNVTVKDAQKSFVDVCGRLHKALRVLDELHTPRQSGQQEGRMESPPREISALARQAFAGIRAVYAVRNTASGREQERDKNIFPRLLELANGYCQKLFTPKQTRELEAMMQTIANAGRFARDSAEKVQYSRESQPQAATKKSKESDTKQSDPVETDIGSIKQSNNSEPKSSSEKSVAGRSVLGFVDAKQAEEAAAIAAAALAYAQSSAAARASSLFGSSYGDRPNGLPVSGTGSWGWLSETPPQGQYLNPGLTSNQPSNGYSAPLMGKYQPWSETENRPIKPSQDGYAGQFLNPLAANSILENPNEDSSAPPGYSKPVSTFGTLEDEWEALSPPGAGSSSYALLAAIPVQTVGVQDEFSAGAVWPSRPDMEMGTVPSYQKGRGAMPLYCMERMPSPTHVSRDATSVYSLERLPSPTNQRIFAAAPQLSPEQLPSPSHQKARGMVPAYSLERLPSPTPDEEEDVPVVQRLPSVESRLLLIESDSKASSALSQPQGVGNLTNPSLLGSSMQSLIRSQSLDTPYTHCGPQVKKENSADLMLVPPNKSATEAVKIPHTIAPKGNFRSRDPRRRLQNHSLDMTDMFGMDLNSLVSPLPGQTVGDAHLAPSEPNRKRFAPELDDKQEVGTEKRQKVQSENDFDTTEFNRDNLHASSGTGGWLDDNVVSSFPTTEEGPITMEVDEVGPSSALEEREVRGRDVNANVVEKFELPNLLTSIGMSKRQKMDLDQQTGESGQRRMKPRDPRRVLLENNVEKGDCLSSDTSRGNDAVTAAPSKSDNGSSVTAAPDVSNRNKTENIPTPIPDASLPNIAPHFLEQLASLAGKVGSNPAPGLVPQGQRIMLSEGAQVSQSAGITARNVGYPGVVETTQNADVAAAPSESISQGSSDHQNEKPAASNTGPRKPKGNPSQWGASQVHPGLEQLLEDLTEDERRSVQLERKRRMEEQDRMFSAGKLCLVLDLDHTLLNSAKFSEIEPEWEQRLRGAETAERSRTNRDVLERRELYRFPHMSMWTKLRPGIWKFLARASQLFELHVYTMGNKVYATEMAKLLDPSGKLFAGRVISKGDDGDGDDLLPKSKDLDGVLGMESAVVIIDDSARVWPHHSQNLIVVERYMYFPCSRRQFGLAGPSLLEVGHDERESDGMLASALGVIDRIHQSFFKHPLLREVDVREILAAQQRQVLAGCKVVFSRVFPVGEAEPHRHPLWRTAEQFGAICTIAIDEQVTHVVAISLGTDKVNWALETGRYVVRPAWLEASTILYRRANEREFPLLPQ